MITSFSHFGQFDLFRPCFDWAQSKLSQVTVTIESLNRQGKVRILKQSGYDFSGKHLCDEYYMDIMWCLCVVVNIQQSVVWFCEKTSIRIFYVILFECKGSLMLKADSVTLNISQYKKFCGAVGRKYGK